MNADQTNQFVHGHVVARDGAVTFKCSTDREKWPWLELHPAHNIVVQSVNYFALTGISHAQGKLDPEKWTALTSFHWQTFVRGTEAAHATHGAADPQPDEERADYAVTFFSADGSVVYRVGGAGVVFRNRDFKAWRDKAKTEILAAPEPENFVYARPADVGAKTPAECLVGTLQREGDIFFTEALVTAENGFRPHHPYHDGSGDHVNSGHLCDAAQQAAIIIRAEAGKSGYPSGGEVFFRRYVELDRTFRLMLTSQSRQHEKMSFRIEQAGKLCAELTFEYAD